MVRKSSLEQNTLFQLSAKGVEGQDLKGQNSLGTTKISWRCLLPDIDIWDWFAERDILKSLFGCQSSSFYVEEHQGKNWGNTRGNTSDIDIAFVTRYFPVIVVKFCDIRITMRQNVIFIAIARLSTTMSKSFRQ